MIKIIYILEIEMLLNEAANFSSAEEVIKTIFKGNAGIGANTFFGGKSLKEVLEDEYVVKQLQSSLNDIKKKVRPEQYNAAVAIFLKKIEKKGAEEFCQFKEHDTANVFNVWIDSIIAYFNNKDKREAKEDKEVKDRIEKYLKSTFNVAFDHDFEKWIEEFFAKNQTMKNPSKEITTLYSQDGWKLQVPNTFAGDVFLAKINGKKTHWCTAADYRNFEAYTRNGNKLYVIRNEDKDVIFQCDFGETRDEEEPGGEPGGHASFKNFDDHSATIREVVQAGVPAELLKLIKNGKGEHMYSKIGNDLEVQKNIKPKEEKSIDTWKITKYASYKEMLSEFPSVLKNKVSLGYTGDRGSKTIEDVLNITKNHTAPDVVGFYKITNGDRVFAFFKTVEERGIFLKTRERQAEDEYDEYDYGEPNSLFEIKNGIVKRVSIKQVVAEKNIDPKVKKLLIGIEENKNPPKGLVDEKPIVSKIGSSHGISIFEVGNAAGLASVLPKKAFSSFIYSINNRKEKRPEAQDYSYHKLFEKSKWNKLYLIILYAEKNYRGLRRDNTYFIYNKGSNIFFDFSDSGKYWVFETKDKIVDFFNSTTRHDPEKLNQLIKVFPELKSEVYSRYKKALGNIIADTGRDKNGNTVRFKLMKLDGPSKANEIFKKYKAVKPLNGIEYIVVNDEYVYNFKNLTIGELVRDDGTFSFNITYYDKDGEGKITFNPKKSDTANLNKIFGFKNSNEHTDFKDSYRKALGIKQKINDTQDKVKDNIK